MFTSTSPQATFTLGRKLGELLEGGSIIALIGELGCGKTLLTRGISAGLGVPFWQVNSPTFVLMNEYQGRLPVFHLDLYRIGGEGEAIELGIMDYLIRAALGVMVIEWAEKVLSILPTDTLKAEFAVLAARKRRITFSSHASRYERLFGGLKI